MLGWPWAEGSAAGFGAETFTSSIFYYTDNVWYNTG